jgi:hypothetical protein
MDLSSHGWIARSVRSHVTPEVFFGAQVNDQHKQIRPEVNRAAPVNIRQPVTSRKPESAKPSD